MRSEKINSTQLVIRHFSFVIRKYFVFLRGKIKKIVMTVVSSQEFATHQKKYLELALNQYVYIEDGNQMFIVAKAPDMKISLSDTSKSKLSDKYRGVFTKEVGTDFMKHTKEMREEWDSRGAFVACTRFNLRNNC